MREQTVAISQLEMEVQFAEGEQIHTENSYKYDPNDIARLATETGFVHDRTWLDDEERFSSNLLMAV